MADASDSRFAAKVQNLQEEDCRLCPHNKRFYGALGANLKLLGTMIEDYGRNPADTGAVIAFAQCLERSHASLVHDSRNGSLQDDLIVDPCEVKTVIVDPSLADGHGTAKENGASVAAPQSVGLTQDLRRSSGQNSTRLFQFAPDHSMEPMANFTSDDADDVNQATRGMKTACSRQLPSQTFTSRESPSSGALRKADGTAGCAKLGKKATGEISLRRRSSPVISQIQDPRVSFDFHMTEHSGIRKSVQHVVLWPGFDVIIGVVIALNAAAIGAESSLNARGEDVSPLFDVLEVCFLFIYVTELALRWSAFGLQVFKNQWIMFDAFIVGCGVIKLTMDTWHAFFDDYDDHKVFAKVMLIRMLRLARLARIVRLMVQFKVLWLLVNGLMHSFGTLFWTLIIMGILLYMFAILGLEVIHEDHTRSDEYNGVVRENFSGLGPALLFLVDGITIDNLGNVYRPLVMEKPALFLYFLGYMLTVCVAMMNLITALMVESAIQQAADDKEVRLAWEISERRRIVDELAVLFVELDKDHSGMVDLNELAHAPEAVRSRLVQLLRTDDPLELERIFHVLDYDNSGCLSVEEFCDGLARILSGTPIELSTIMKQCKDILQMERASVVGTSVPVTMPSADDLNEHVGTATV